MLLCSVPPLGFLGFEKNRAETPRPRRMSQNQPNDPAGEDRSREQARLVAAMAQGDKAAMGSLYDQLSGPLYSLAYRMLGDAGEAQDLTQDIFLQLWRTAGSYDAGRGSVFSWAATLVRNRAIDRIRMRQRRSELLAQAAPDLQPTAPGGDADSAGTLWLQEKATAVRAALAEIAPDQKQAIELAFFGGLTQQEIAARLNEPLGTIKARIRRGLLKLKDRLPARL
ncbi:ECF RNA polymerase sigma factor SigK [Lacunisphaera limnophila]|uniref:ECF RNA polymerase sigma factor SigK n=2 Tax=Lacunisphaera limnophila TaxID=1838286 RepID=A0A1D8AX31_9BACT|nr:ECF RNA polymerase sigma factor SigK [Lacunisphaera limnophila]